MDAQAESAWRRWLELYLARSLAADAKVPEHDVLPVVASIRHSVIADERAGVPVGGLDSFPSQPW